MIYNVDSVLSVQLVNDETPTCWTMSFTDTETKKNDGKQFKGVGSGP
jgi:hypothetical protein